MKAIITVIGKDKTGIIYNVSKVLSECEVNIDDISQTVMQDYFTMLMLVTIDEEKTTFKQLKAELDKTAENVGLSIRVQKEEIFDTMHKI
ncbi:ACT domain-containing protein [Anaerofustis sp.]|uniref:ACT domain-containing protein n=1 Tax=Anaerofustis sp. TaxID=1872517 RepID=UPI0025C122F8|nr:ACT domain-containing protein [Anaerofustis sp.]